MGSKIVLKLVHDKGKMRNSEGSFVTLADGRIMYAYTRFRGGSWSDEGAADIAARYSTIPTMAVRAGESRRTGGRCQ